MTFKYVCHPILNTDWPSIICRTCLKRATVQVRREGKSHDRQIDMGKSIGYFCSTHAREYIKATKKRDRQ